MIGRICSLKRYLQKDLHNDEFFYKNVMSSFMERMPSMDEITRKKKIFPSKNRLKKVKNG
jgi:hypothetical protein